MLLALNRANTPFLPLSLSLSFSVHVCVSVRERGVCRALLQDSWLPPTRAGLFFCFSRVSCVYFLVYNRDVTYLVTTVQEVTRSNQGV